MYVNLLSFAGPNIVKVGRGTKYFTKTAKIVGKQYLTKQLGGGSERGLLANTLQPNLQNKPFSHEENVS